MRKFILSLLLIKKEKNAILHSINLEINYLQNKIINRKYDTNINFEIESVEELRNIKNLLQ